jgi:uncharacterized protein with HEPN domain
MRDRPYKLFLEDIISSIEKIDKYTKDLSFDDFQDNSLTVDAVIRNLEIIGEATKNIPPDIRSGYPYIPWGRMIGLRNIVSHKYFSIDLSIIWQIVTVNLPETKPLIKRMIKDIPED